MRSRLEGKKEGRKEGETAPTTYTRIASHRHTAQEPSPNATSPEGGRHEFHSLMPTQIWTNLPEQLPHFDDTHIL